MGQKLSYGGQHHHEHHGLFVAVQNGKVDKVEAMIDENPNVLRIVTVNVKLSPLHVVAVNGQIEVLCILLDRGVNPDILNRHKQTPLMLAAMHEKVSCVERLIQQGANILMFDSLHRRTCLHYAAYHGHSDCLQSILASAHLAPKGLHACKGFARFMNIKDGSGATPLHLAARHGRPACVRILLSNEALVCVSTGSYGRPGSTPLHLAAREGSLDCVRELLTWGADRLYRDSSGRIPYVVALKYKQEACAAIVNPSSPEPLTWPSPLKFITELDSKAKALLENTLIEANKDREKLILEKIAVSQISPLHCDSGLESDDFELSFMNSTSAVSNSLILSAEKLGLHMESKEAMKGNMGKANEGVSLSYVASASSRPAPLRYKNAAIKCVLIVFCPCVATINPILQNKLDTYEEVLSPSRPRKSRMSFSLAEGGSSSSSTSGLRVLSPLASFERLGGRHSGKISAKCIEVFAKP
ncbi:putative E3 ubiquitin-protein ligase XBOS31 [Capsicum annuum]|uniref:E3 ubiquitin-protein ligase XBOS31 n=1 Tax=Capsicum annuum TaxID=4072 RepID=A0A2G2YQW0_CAPAN|nr:putative E3 ubiquitin-protein ligase XBOS31 [Capsicum annuum]